MLRAHASLLIPLCFCTSIIIRPFTCAVSKSTTTHTKLKSRKMLAFLWIQGNHDPRWVKAPPHLPTHCGHSMVACCLSGHIRGNVQYIFLWNPGKRTILWRQNTDNQRDLVDRWFMSMIAWHGRDFISCTSVLIATSNVTSVTRISPSKGDFLCEVMNFYISQRL